MSAPGGARVDLVHASKRFGVTQALDDVTLTIEPGEIHALVGENGAGKSTIGKIIGGLYVLDTGSLEIDGVPVGRWDPSSALASGIATIQQELALVPALSVAENVFLGIEQQRFGVLSGNRARRYDELSERVGFGIPGNVPVRELRLADQQKVEIMRALARNARLLVLDEPTSSLTKDESDRLHEVMRSLKSEGRTLVYVSHFLDEVIEVSDRISVMRDGRLICTNDAATETKSSLIESMLGRKLDVAFPPLPPVADDAPVVYLAEGLTGPVARDIDVEVRAGEILGLAGLVGSGRTELARMICGADPITSGVAHLDDVTLPKLDVTSAIDHGIVMLPEDRRSLGLIMTQNVRENVTLPSITHFMRGLSLNRSAERDAVRDKIETLGVVPPRVDGELRYYSGGNQQKALFAKWTLELPRVLVLDEPTRGVDIGSKRAIYDAIIDVAERGVAIILISSELEEVLLMSHRLALISGGRIIDVQPSSSLSVDTVLDRLFHADEMKVSTNT